MWDWEVINWADFTVQGSLALLLGVGTVIVSIRLASWSAKATVWAALQQEERDHARRLQEIEDAHFRVAVRDLMSAVAYMCEMAKRVRVESLTEGWARLYGAVNLIETTDRDASIDIGVWTVAKLHKLLSANSLARGFTVADDAREEILGRIHLWMIDPETALEFMNADPDMP